MSYDLVRLALLTLPPPPEYEDEAYLEPEQHNPAILSHELAAGLEVRCTAYQYVIAVQRWLMAVRWRTSMPHKNAPALPHTEWKRLLRPWLASLTTESHSAHGQEAGFDGWNLLCNYMHLLEKGESPEGLGGLTLAEHRARDAESMR